MIGSLRHELFRLFAFTARVLIIAVVIISAAGIGVLLFADSLNDSSDPYDGKRTIQVEGVAKDKVVPDSARVTLGKSLRGSDPLQLQTDATNAINKLIAELKKINIKDEQINTSNYSLAPVYNEQRDITSYTIGIAVTVTLEKTNPKDNMASKVIAAGSTSGINEVRNLDFFLSDQEKLERELEDEAIADAREQAKKRAEAVGLKLGEVLDINGSIIYPSYRDNSLKESMAVDGAAAAAPAPSLEVKPGEQEIQKRVTLVFEVK